jgi:hypothetical protein
VVESRCGSDWASWKFGCFPAATNAPHRLQSAPVLRRFPNGGSGVTDAPLPGNDGEDAEERGYPIPRPIWLMPRNSNSWKSRPRSCGYGHGVGETWVDGLEGMERVPAEQLASILSAVPTALGALQNGQLFGGDPGRGCQLWPSSATSSPSSSRCGDVVQAARAHKRTGGR